MHDNGSVPSVRWTPLSSMQFIYDMWWGLLTPDKDFPRDVRRVLNDAFGELAFRARKTDVKILLRWAR